MEQRLKMLRRLAGRLAAVAVCGLGLLGGTDANAALVIRVTYAGSDFDFTGAGSLTLTPGELATLNGDLAMLGAEFEFAALAATSSSPSGNPGVLAQSALINAEEPTTDTVIITVTDTDYVTGLPTFRMDSSSSSTFTNTQAPPDTTETAFTSWFNPNNMEFDKQEVSPTVTLTSTGGLGNNSQSGDAAPTAISAQTTYGLTNEVVITIGPQFSTAADSVIQHQGSTTVVGIIPEPATVAMLLGILPLGAVRLLRRRGAKA